MVTQTATTCSVASHPRPAPLGQAAQAAETHLLGKKLSIMRSPRGFTASSPICWRSRRL